LALGWRYFLLFAWKTGALSEAEAYDQWQRAWDTLLHLAGIQAQHQQEAEPTQRFLDLLQDVIASGRAYLQKIVANGDSTYTSQRFGIDGESEYKGERIGWISDAHIFLVPDVSYAVAQRLGNEVGNGLTVKATTLRKRLNEKGLIAETEPSRQTLLVRKHIDGTRESVLAIFTTALSRGKKPDQPDHETPTPHSWSGFLPPLVSRWSGFLEKTDHNILLNNKDLPDRGQVGQVFYPHRDTQENLMPFGGQVSPKKPDHGDPKPDHGDPKTDHLPSTHPLIAGEQVCLCCGTLMEETQSEGPAESRWQCPVCPWWVIYPNIA
jgi:hypothetical protein